MLSFVVTIMCFNFIDMKQKIILRFVTWNANGVVCRNILTHVFFRVRRKISVHEKITIRDGMRTWLFDETFIDMSGQVLQTTPRRILCRPERANKITCHTVRFYFF